MERKSTENLDILVYALSILLTFTLLFISNKLSSPLVLEIEAGASVMDLMFNSEDSIKHSLHLLLPLLLLTLGLIILFKSLWELGKGILFNEDALMIKTFMGILFIILFILSIKVLLNGWALFLIALICIFISLVIFAIIGSLLNNSSETY